MKRLPLLALVAVFLHSCRPVFEDNPGLTVFRYNESTNISSLDPAFAREIANIWPCNQIFNGLLQLDDSLNIRPCIAKSWETDPDGTTYTFHLRNDVYFQDHPFFPDGKGRRVTASDFVYSFNRIVDPKLLSPGIWVFEKVAETEGKYSFTAVDDTTLEIGLKEPFPPFAGILTMMYCSVVPKEIVEHYGNDFRSNPVGTGPFRFQTWEEGEKLVLVKNDHYFETENGDRLPYLDAVAVTFLADKQAAFLEFIKGNLDFINGLDQSYKDEMLTKDGQLRPRYRERYNLVTAPYLNTEYIGILVDTSLEIVKKSPLRHKEIRQAINFAFDRSRMIKFLRNNIGHPGFYGIIPPGLPSFDNKEKIYIYDPDKARQLIREAGYSSPEDVPEFTLHTTPEYVDLFKYIQHQLQELGLRMNIEVNPAAALMAMKSQGKLNMFRASWVADYPDAENYLSLFLGRNMAPAGPNYTRFHDTEYDKMYEQSQQTNDEAERQLLYRQMNRKAMEEAPVIILYYDQAVRFTRKDITGLGSNPLNLLTLKRVKK
jgi:oligopeptide transport system substrate-binding protein